MTKEEQADFDRQRDEERAAQIRRNLEDHETRQASRRATVAHAEHVREHDRKQLLLDERRVAAFESIAKSIARIAAKHGCQP